MDARQSRHQMEERLNAESTKLKEADEEIGWLCDELEKKDKELEVVKADMSEAKNVLTRAVNDAAALRDTAEQKWKSAQKKLETLKDSLHRLVSAIFGESAKVLFESGCSNFLYSLLTLSLFCLCDRQRSWYSRWDACYEAHLHVFPGQTIVWGCM